MSRQRYTEEFKVEAVKQVTERGHPVTEVAARAFPATACISGSSAMPSLLSNGNRDDGLHVEDRRLKAELKRVSEELDILKKATAYFTRESD